MEEEKERYLTLNKINSYKIAYGLSNHVWDIVIKWDYFSKKTVGDQLVRAIDSISANIAEGFGRYGKKDKVQFYRIARASVFETFDWLEKSKKRNLISEKEYDCIFKELKKLPKEINWLIGYTNKTLND